MGLSSRIKITAGRFWEDILVALENLLRSPAEDRLCILDDIFPHLLSAFRIAEYNCYLEHFSAAQVHSTATAFPVIGEHRSFAKVVDEYERRYPQYKNRVFKFNTKRNLASRLIYTVFINNAFRFIEIAERHSVPFVFTLYPGGGFKLNDTDVDGKLRRVFSSPSFRKVIVTQRISYEYLMNKELCPQDEVLFIYGVVVPEDYLTNCMGAKQYYQQDKDTFDICFVAHKYTARGTDKGYDVFVEVAKSLARTYPDMSFHVIGPFDETDVDVSDIREQIKFYGTRYTGFLLEFYPRMDVILSPNVPFVLSPGAFDGFPTGSCVEAGLCGVAVFCTDILNLNIAFKNGEEIVIIPRDVDEICNVIIKYYKSPDDLYLLASKGQEAFRRAFSFEAQIMPRLRIMSEYVEQTMCSSFAGQPADQGLSSHQPVAG